MSLSLNAVCKNYGRHRALYRITAEFPAGRISVVLGPNGAGKSTLMGILSTLVAPTTGTATWQGQPRAPGTPLRAQIGYVGHEPGLYPDLGARANLILFASLYGLHLAPTALAARLKAVGLAEDLEGRLELPVRAFSRGMQQRLALARALLHDPSLLLFDEPSAALDPTGAVWLAEHLRQAREAGRTVIVITHDLGLAASLADRILLLRRGRVAIDRTLETPLPEAALRTLYEETLSVPA